jgi:gamma-glutamyltranspeptidase/glutathione hydrolase
LINTLCANNGMATAPHHLASQSALKVLRDGGNAIEAMVAAAATIAVVYPHMNSIGGDGFWLILKPNGAQIAIDASGAAAAGAKGSTAGAGTSSGTEGRVAALATLPAAR